MTKGRSNQRRGQAVERFAAHRLVYLGFEMVCKISTPMAKIRGQWRHCGKAEGDLRAVGPGGVSVLAEVKSRPETLCFNDLEPHQVQRLDQHQALGGISLLVWHNRAGIYVLPWDIMRAQGFKAGESIGLCWAERTQLLRSQLNTTEKP